MKKLTLLLCATFLCLSLASPVIARDTKLIDTMNIYDEYSGRNVPYDIYESTLPITLHMDGHFVPSDVEPLVEKGRALIPFRVAAEAVGGTVDWNANTKQATVCKDNTTLVFTLNQSSFTKNGQTYPLDVPVKLHQNRLLLPLRALSQALNLPVKWDNTPRTISIGKPFVIEPYLDDPDLDDYQNQIHKRIDLLMQKYAPQELSNYPLTGTWQVNIKDCVIIDFFHHLKSDQYINYSIFNARSFIDFHKSISTLSKGGTLTFNNNDCIYSFGPGHGPGNTKTAFAKFTNDQIIPVGYIDFFDGTYMPAPDTTPSVKLS